MFFMVRIYLELGTLIGVTVIKVKVIYFCENCNNKTFCTFRAVSGFYAGTM